MSGAELHEFGMSSGTSSFISPNMSAICHLTMMRRLAEVSVAVSGAALAMMLKKSLRPQE